MKFCQVWIYDGFYTVVVIYVGVEVKILLWQYEIWAASSGASYHYK